MNKNGDESHVNTPRGSADESPPPLSRALDTLSTVIPGCLASLRMSPDGSFDIPYCSDRIGEICGLKREELRESASAFLDRIHPEDRPRARASLLRSRETLEPCHVEFRYRHPDGREVWLESRSAPQADDGCLVWHGIVTDITQRRLTEDRRPDVTAARDSEKRLMSPAAQTAGREETDRVLPIGQERFQALTEPLSEAIWVMDAGTGEILYTSPAFGRMLGQGDDDPSDVLDRWMSAVHADDLARVRAHFTALRQVNAASVETYRVVRRDGAVRWVRSRAACVQEGERHARVIGLIDDVTEQRRLEEHLQRAQKMESMGQLASGVAHDFNNWLTVIIGYIELLGTMVPGDSMASKCVAEIRRASERATGLTRQLLAFSRNEPIAPRVLEINALVSDTQRMLRRLLGEDIALTSVLSPSVGLVKVDPTQWVQVLTNLAVNARDAMPTGGRLTIETAAATIGSERAAAHGVEPGRFVCVAVTDSGCGIPADVQSRVFEPFFTTKGAGQGTGLGLAVVFMAVERSGGFVELTSGAGVGTQFRLFLPEATEAPASASALNHADMTGSERVLVVEDETSLRDVACHTLKGYGYDVLQAAGGDDALKVLAERGEDIDILFTDVVMPDKGGREVADAAKANWPHIRIIYTSGYTDDAILRYGIALADVAFLPKPYTPRELLTKIRSVMS